ncbi:hypothetical protein [Clostridium kluyveri]|uniref:Uncharacterized protein n=1 Tax=Clostridium kluyveri TaxID=1534 RepID=A0A1L5FAY1_CLOKL|nr:hypothetical protein [Clostridium kluyveri]APM40178.1 hypothetical protein BS101_16230 [Clostridium kluyveri]
MGQSLDKFTLYAIRANDIFPTVSKVISGDLSTNLSKTKDIGALSSLIKIIKNVKAVIPKEKFLYLASNIGIDQYAFEYYLKELQDIGFINVTNTNNVENTVPLFSLDIYNMLGKKLKSYNPSEIELKHFEIINNVAELPTKITDLNDILDVSANEMKLFKRIGSNCGYLDTYVSPVDGKDVLYSPIYWDENPEKLFELVDKYSHQEVFNKISAIRSSQGKPVSSIGKDLILSEAVAAGCLPTNSVESAGGRQFFVFTPTIGVKKYEKDIIKKARQIVACVRYGQEFAQITRIKNIMNVLNSLLRKGYIGDHSENIYQYGILITMGLVYPVKAYYGHKIYLNDTQENRKIFQIAIEMLRSGIITNNDINIDADDLQRIFKSDKVFSEELSTISSFKKEIPNDSNTLQKIGDILRGVDEDVFK